MAHTCDICSKKTVAGGSHMHHRGIAGGQWKRRAQHTKRDIGVNLHWVSLPVKGVMTRMFACAKCIKRIRFDIRKASKVAVT
jgi:ribosomal protein L28